MKVVRYESRSLSKLIDRDASSSKRISDKVKRILDDVRISGDAALLKYTRKFDRVKLTPKELLVTEDEINGCYQNIEPAFTQHLKVAIENVRNFYRTKIKSSVKVKREEGVYLAERHFPMENVGVYVPAGTVPLISSVYMTVLPAQAAGVKNIYLITPPNEFKSVDPHILATANLLKVNAIYKAGGAQAIAAMAYGTKTIPRMDKIVGPGNQYVAEAKRQVFGYCDIDMVAGPTELLVLANDHTDPSFVIADMLAQAEHTMGISILVTTSKRLINAVKKLPIKGFVVKVKNLNQATDLINRIAPEHLQIMIKRPERILKNIRNAGAVFLGPYSPTAIGDYIAGPSHVLPTNGSARFFSGLGVRDFMKTTHVIGFNKKALERVRKSGEYLAGLEGLKRHRDSIRVRFDN